jgi:hypothetical protein
VVRSDSRDRPHGLRYADRILLASAARTRSRIYAPLSQVTTAPPKPGASGRERIGAKPAPVRRGATWSSRFWHGPRAHCCEAEGHAAPCASFSEEGCCALRGGRNTNRNRRTRHKALGLACGHTEMVGEEAVTAGGASRPPPTSRETHGAPSPIGVANKRRIDCGLRRREVSIRREALACVD